VWNAKVTKIIHQKTGCPKCAGRPRVDNIEIDNRIIYKHLEVKRCGDYVNASTKIKWLCLMDADHIWFASPKDVISHSTGCPHCQSLFGTHTVVDDIKFVSKREAKTFLTLRDYSQRYNFTIILQKKYNKFTRHTCDFYIPEYKLWIEVGNIKTEKYLTNISNKRGWVEQMGEHFIFGDDSETIEQQVNDFINKDL
jgi:hypothetical protein